MAINGGCRSRDKGIIRLRLTSGNGAPKRWQVPSFLYPADSIAGGGGGDQVSNVLISDVHEVTINHTVDPFELMISYHQGGNQITIWNSSELRLVFKDQYLEWSTWLDPNVTLYGAGERSSKNFHLIRQGAPRTLWNHDLGPTFVEQNSYGSHPFTMALSPDGSHAWGYFLLNSNAMDIIPASDRLSWRVTGGELDFFILVGPTPADVMDQFTQVIGRPAFMPYWSLGWHQCKYGYRSIWEVEQVVDNYSRAGIPLEAAWTDIDHMSRWKDFTFDEKEFPIDEMRRFVQRLEKNNQRWVPIFDPGIKTEPGYTPYERGLAEDVFIKSYDAKQPTKPYLGWVWPGPAVYPDFLHPRGRRYFQSFLAEHHAQVKWGGAWIDMDEAANFCTGDACFPKDNSASLHKLRDDPDPPPWVCDLNCSVDLRPELNTTWRKLLDPPYAVSNSLSRLPLGTKVISVIATHLDGSLQYNTHNLYGLAHAMTVYEGMKEIMVGKRPFILTRSSFSGTGAYAAHWTGDNAATWDDLAMSIPAVLSYGIFGMPMGGADVCGFGGNTTEELCARWVALAALAYPFARSHADIHSSRQEPYLWESVARTARTTLGFRYSILPYLYTLHKVAHETGTPVAQPLWFHHAHDVKTHTLDRQVMMGPAFLVTPVLRPGVTRVTGYLPNINGSWYEVTPGLGGASSDHIPTAIQGGVTVESDAPLDWIPVHMRGGHIVPFQVSGMTTLQVRKSDLTIVAALKRPIENLAGDGVQEAAGRMYHDDGESFSNGFDDSAQGLGCSWMEFHLTVDSSRGVHKAEMVVGFKNFTPPPCADGASVGVAWPKLAPIKVLGWSIPAENVTFSTITKAGAKRVGWANAKVRRVEITFNRSFLMFIFRFYRSMYFLFLNK